MNFTTAEKQNGEAYTGNKESLTSLFFSETTLFDILRKYWEISNIELLDFIKKLLVT